LRPDDDGSQHNAEAWHSPSGPSESGQQPRSKAIQVPGIRSKRWHEDNLEYPVAYYKPPFADLPGDLLTLPPGSQIGHEQGNCTGTSDLVPGIGSLRHAYLYDGCTPSQRSLINLRYLQRGFVVTGPAIIEHHQSTAAESSNSIFSGLQWSANSTAGKSGEGKLNPL